MLNLTPDQVLEILKTGRSKTWDLRLTMILNAFRARFLAIMRKEYPRLGTLAEDTIELALEKLIQNSHRIEDPNKIEGYAIKIFINTVLDFVRNDKRAFPDRVYPSKEEKDIERWLDKVQVESASSGSTTEEKFLASERVRIVRKVLAGLKPFQRELVELKFIYDLSDRQIADRLQVSNYAIRGRLKRLRVVLRDAFGGSG